MAQFFYTAKHGLNEVVDGVIDAVNQEEALNSLQQQGLFPIKIEPSTVIKITKKKIDSDLKMAVMKKARLVLPGILKRKVSAKEVLIFTQKLATLTRARVELFAGLKILYDQTEEVELKNIILQISQSIKEGKVFSDSLQQFPNVFSPFFINVIRAGEASGRLDLALEQIGEFLYQQDNLKSKVKVALAYPVFLLMVGLVSIFVLINFVVPRLAGMLEGVGRELPLITRVILDISKFSQQTSVWILPVICLVCFGLVWFNGVVIFKRLAFWLKNIVPVIKRIFLHQELTHFSRSLSLLIKSGVSALKALEISSQNVEDEELKQQLKKVCAGVARGDTISKGLDLLTTMPDFFVKMIVIGEESGRLVDVLEEVTKTYSRELEYDVAIMSSLLEPLLILCLGLVLGTIVFAIMLPIFQITQFVQ